MRFDFGKISRRSSKMTFCARQGSTSLVSPVDDPEKMVQERILGPSMMLAAEKGTKDIRPPGREEDTSSAKKQITKLQEKETINYDGFLLRSSLQLWFGTRDDAVIPRREVYNIIEILLQEAQDALD